MRKNIASGACASTMYHIILQNMCIISAQHHFLDNKKTDYMNKLHFYRVKQVYVLHKVKNIVKKSIIIHFTEL